MRTRPSARRWGALLALVPGISMLVPGPASAHDKTDVLVLTNGDRLQGEIKKVAQGTLTLSTDAAGTLSFKWAYVASLVSAFPFQVRATSGKDYFGTLAEPDRPGEIKVVSPSETHAVALSDVFVIMPMEHSFWQQLDGSIDFGFSYVRSTKAVQYSLSAETHYKTRKLHGDLQLNSLFSSQEDAESASQQNLDLVLLRPLSALDGRGNLIAIGQLQSNPNQGFDLRTVAGGGFGALLHQASGGFALLSVGAGVDREAVTDSSEVNTDVEALVSLRWVRYRTSYPRRRFSLGLSTFTNITHSPRFRVQLRLRLSWEIVRHLIVALNFLDNYDSRPPTEDATKNDFSFTTSLGYTF